MDLSDYDLENDIDITNSHNLITSDDIHLGEFINHYNRNSNNNNNNFHNRNSTSITPTHGHWRFPRTNATNTIDNTSAIDNQDAQDTSSGLDDIEGLSLTQFGMDGDNSDGGIAIGNDVNCFSNSVGDSPGDDDVNIASSIPRRCGDAVNYDDDDDYQSSIASSMSFSVNYKKRRMTNIYDNASGSATAACSTESSSSGSSGSSGSSSNSSVSDGGNMNINRNRNRNINRNINRNRNRNINRNGGSRSESKTNSESVNSSDSDSGGSESSSGGVSSSMNDNVSDVNYTNSEGECFFMSPDGLNFTNPTPNVLSPPTGNNGIACTIKFNANNQHTIYSNNDNNHHNRCYTNSNSRHQQNSHFEVRSNTNKKVGNISSSSITSTTPTLLHQMSPKKASAPTKSPKTLLGMPLLSPPSSSLPLTSHAGTIPVVMAPPVINPKVTLSLAQPNPSNAHTEKGKQSSFQLDKDILDASGRVSPSGYMMAPAVDEDDEDVVDVVDDSDTFEDHQHPPRQERVFVQRRYKTKVTDTSSFSSPSLSPCMRGRDRKGGGGGGGSGRRVNIPSRRYRGNDVSNDDTDSYVAKTGCGKRYNYNSSTTTTTPTTATNTNSSTDDEDDDEDDDDGYNEEGEDDDVIDDVDDDDDDDDEDENIIIDYGEGTERDDVMGCHDQSYTFTDVEGIDDIINDNFGEDDDAINNNNGNDDDGDDDGNNAINREDLHIHENAFSGVIHKTFSTTSASSPSSSSSHSSSLTAGIHNAPLHPGQTDRHRYCCCCCPTSPTPPSISHSPQQQHQHQQQQDDNHNHSHDHSHNHSHRHSQSQVLGNNGENDIVVTVPPRAPTISAIARNRGYYDDDDSDDGCGCYGDSDESGNSSNEVFSMFMDAKYAMRKLIAAEYARSLIRSKGSGPTLAAAAVAVLARPCWKLIKASLELTPEKVPSNVEAFSCTSEIFRYNLVKVVSYILTQVSAESNVAAAQGQDADQPTRRQSTSCSRRSFECRSAARHTSTLETFIMRFREYTAAGPEIFLMALILIDRYTEKTSVTSDNVNRVWTAAFICVSKLYDDFCNK